MKFMKVLPNFTILAEVMKSVYFESIGVLSLHTERQTNVETVDTFKLTPKSYWNGLNIAISDNEIFDQQLPDFVDFLKQHSEAIPENVLNEIQKWKSKFGLINMIGDDCILVKDPELLKEVLNNNKIKSYIYQVEGNVVFLSELSGPELSNLFQEELGLPVRVHVPRRRFEYNLNKRNIMTKEQDNLPEILKAAA